MGFFRRLGQIRSSEVCLQEGELHWLFTSGSLLAYKREKDGKSIVTAVNTAATRQTLTLPWQGKTATDLITGKTFPVKDGMVVLTLESTGAMLLA